MEEEKNMPNNKIWKKVLVIGILFLFIGLAVIPSTVSNTIVNKPLKTNMASGSPPLPALMWTEDFLTFYFLIIDPDEDDIFLYMEWGDGTYEDWFGPYESGEIISHSHVWSDEGTYQIKIKSRDEDGESPEAVYSSTLSSNFKFFYPSLGYVDMTYKFTIYLKDFGLYIFNWGDGTYSDWVTGITNKSFSDPGEYVLKWKAKDIYGYETTWSDPIFITILLIGNQPPTAPDVNGTKNGEVGVQYNWTFVSTDPEGENVTYYIAWSNQCGDSEYHGPYPSGEEIVVAHSYGYRGSYIIKAMAYDENGTESDWTYYEVSMPRNKNLYNSFFSQLFNKFLLIKNLLYLL